MTEYTPSKNILTTAFFNLFSLIYLSIYLYLYIYLYRFRWNNYKNCQRKEERGEDHMQKYLHGQVKTPMVYLIMFTSFL